MSSGFAKLHPAVLIPPSSPAPLRKNRLLITCDKDFGELVYKHGAKASHGIVQFSHPATVRCGSCGKVANTRCVPVMIGPGTSAWSRKWRADASSAGGK